MARKASTLGIAEPTAVLVARDAGEHAREERREALRQIRVIAPWTTHVAHEPSFSAEMNHELATRVQELIFDELERIYVRLKKQQDDSDAAGLISKKAMSTLLESRLVVKAKRKIDVQRLSYDMIAAMKTAIATMSSPGLTPRSESSPSRPPQPTSRLSHLLHDKVEKKATNSPAAAILATMAIHQNTKSRQPRASQQAKKGVAENSQVHHGPLYVDFPPSSPRLSDLIAEADAAADSEDLNSHVTNFRQRPVAPSAVHDAGSPVTRREAKPNRVRYIMSTRMGALPPTKNILEEYPIPKEILDALETHRHYHIDESSLMSSFDSIKAGRSGDWECYFRRSVPLERKPVSFVLSSLEIAHERPMPPPSDIFQQQLLESATNDDIMLTEVQKLYDHTHESYRDFRASLHRHLDLPYLVDLSLRSSLNSTSYFLEDELVSSEPTVQIPEYLFRTTNSLLITKWRLVKKGATGRINTRRGAIAVRAKVELSKAQRNELLAKICHFTPNEVQLMDLWYSYDADAVETTPFDPIPMMPDLSNRFDAVWKDLSMPANERLDLAIKYCSLEASSRLPDAVAVWEVAAALIREREELLQLAQDAIAAPKKTVAMISEEIALLQDLATTTAHVKEALMLTYIEVGDFVTYAGNFYLTKMEREATELQQKIVESLEATTKHRASPEEEDMIAAAAAAAAAYAHDRESAQRDTWV